MRSALEQVLRGIAAPAIAVSGGVDSVTLAALACELARDVLVVHAVSPAVPASASARVKELAARRHWSLAIVDAGEFADPRYRANPVNRCFFCKSNLYAAIRHGSSRPILSGANTDDLGEYRPGLEAARGFGVRHPYIEAGIDKSGVRRIARELGLEEVAELPASPCLSSRVETGIRIEAATLGFIHEIEQLVAARTRAATVRCRVRAAALAIELDADAYASLDANERQRLIELITLRPDRPPGLPIRFEPYRNGSAFLRGAHGA